MGVEIQSTRVTEPPLLYPGFNFYIEAFWRLHTCRPQGMSSVAWIPWTATNDYAIRYGLNEETVYYRFVFFMESLDEAYRSYVNSKAEAQKEQEEAGKDNGAFNASTTK